MNMMKSETLYMLFMSLKISATTQREKIKFIVKWTWFRTYVNKHKIGFKINYNQTFKLCQKDKQIIMFSWKKTPTNNTYVHKFNFITVLFPFYFKSIFLSLSVLGKSLHPFHAFGAFTRYTSDNTHRMQLIQLFTWFADCWRVNWNGTNGYGCYNEYKRLFIIRERTT